MFGLGAVLIAIAGGLGKWLSPNASESDLASEYCERLYDLEDEVNPLRLLPIVGPEEGYDPCQLQFRQARLRSEDKLKEMRGVTRHPNFAKMLKMYHGDPDCSIRKHRGSAGKRLDQAIRNIHHYDELFRDWECPMVWTEDQG